MNKRLPMIKISAVFFSAFTLSFHCVADELRIYFIDVEQADATLLVSPSGKTLLVDSGRNGMGDRIKAVMDEAGVTAIDHFVATHYHEDHFGGIDDLVELGVPVNRAYDRGDKQFLPVSKTSQKTYLDYEAAVGSEAVHLMRGETIPFDDDIVVTAISSGGVVLGETNPVPAADENDMSLSLLINYQGFQLFLGGDMEEPTEAKIADLDLVTDVDLYKSNHHGSDTSSIPGFMEDLKPSLIIISNGNRADYQHPRLSTLRTYSGLTPTPMVLQTNKYINGGDSFGNVDDQFIADLPPNDTNGTIRIVVDSDTREMSVSYTDHIHSLPLKNAISNPKTFSISAVLPDPTGNDRINEIITLQNQGSTDIQLDDYRLIDESGRLWLLTGILHANETLEVQRNAMPMSLNNEGDRIRLITVEGEEIDQFEYGQSEPGVSIYTGH